MATAAYNLRNNSQQPNTSNTNTTTRPTKATNSACDNTPNPHHALRNTEYTPYLNSVKAAPRQLDLPSSANTADGSINCHAEAALCSQ